MNFKQTMCESFLAEWRKRPKATLHWVLPGGGEPGRWQMRLGKKILMKEIPHWVGDWVWRKKELAKDVFPDPHAPQCIWHLELKP